MNNTEEKEIEIGEKYLPIGTVAMLKGGSKRVMITGFCTVAQEQLDKLYDYSGCIYPEGFIESNQVCLFDHSQIEKIYHLGLIDNEERDFKQKLTTAINTIGEENLLKVNSEMVNTELPDFSSETLNEESDNSTIDSEIPVSNEIPSVPASSEMPVMPTASEIPSMPTASEVPSMPSTTDNNQ